MVKVKKNLTLILMGTILVFSMLAAGCAPQGVTSSPQSSSQVSASATQAPKVQLIHYIRYSVPKNADKVLAKVNELLEKKINANLTLNFVEPGDYDNKMQLVNSAGEVYDLCFTSGWANPYEPNVIKGAYLALDDLLKEFPNVKALTTDKIWDGTKVNGKIYGVPNLQLMYDQKGLVLKKDLVDKYSIDVKSIKSYADLTAAYQKIKTGEPDVIEIVGGAPDSWFIDYYPATPGNLVIDTKTWKVVDPFETVYLDGTKAMRDWYLKGFFPKDIATLKDDKPLMQSGKAFSRYQRQIVGGEATAKSYYGADFVLLPTSSMVISQGSIRSTLTAISSTSKNPKKAMEYIQLLGTDKEVYNTLVFGLEGQDYKKISDTRIEPIADQYSVYGWMIGNTFNSFLLPGQPDDLMTKTKANNEAALTDPTFTLSFDTTSITTEMAQMDAVYQEYYGALCNGIDDTDKLLKARGDKMKAAGRDKVIAELQKQVDAWKLKNK